MTDSEAFTYIQFLLSEVEKAAFKRACTLNRTTMTRELRRFIYQYCQTAEAPDRSVYDAWLSEHQKSYLGVDS